MLLAVIYENQRSVPLLELTSKIDFKVLVCKIHADDDKGDNTHNGSRKVLTSSMAFHMKVLNISEVSKTYKPQNVRYISTKNHANHIKLDAKINKDDNLWLRHSNYPTYFKLHTSCIQSLFKDGSNTMILTVDVVFFVFGITGIRNLANQKL